MFDHNKIVGNLSRLTCMFLLWQAGGSTGLLMDLAANEKAVHSDFFNGKDYFTCLTAPSFTITQKRLNRRGLIFSLKY